MELEIADFVRGSFNEFIEKFAVKYQIADKAVYTENILDYFPKQSKAKIDSINKFLLNESDVKVKFGGYLEARLIKEKSLEYTLHSEMPIYTEINHDKRAKKCDLTVHSTALDRWLKRDDWYASLRVAIEIKYAPFANPDAIFKNTLVSSDIDRLENLNEKVAKFFMIFDEGNKISDCNVTWLKQYLTGKKIQVLSNNSKFNF